MKLRLEPQTTLILVVSIMFGGLINIPIRRIGRPSVVIEHPLAAFGLMNFWPALRRIRRESEQEWTQRAGVCYITLPPQVQNGNPNPKGGTSMTKGIALSIALLILVASPSAAPAIGANCQGLPDAGTLKAKLIAVAGPSIGGLFNGERMWAAVVNRNGEVCAFAASKGDPTQVWPGSQAIAKSKAYTANAFSLDSLALSTARLYTFTQPGHSLWSLGQSNLFDPKFLAPPGGQGGGDNQIVGGLIFFGGGVPLYKEGKIIGGLGVSGDTSCADHEVAKGVRDQLGLNPPGGKLTDDIIYPNIDGPSEFGHPLCNNTKRNGSAKLGDETKAISY